MLVEIDRLLGDAADHDAIAEHVEHQDIELAWVSQELFQPRPELAHVAHRRANHPQEPIITYVEFFRERQQARYANAEFIGTGIPSAATTSQRSASRSTFPIIRRR